MASRVDVVTIELPADALTPRLARRAVSERLGHVQRCEELLLCVSEVVTNAVLHARTHATMTLTVDGARVRVEVADGNPALPVRRDHDLHAPTGRGLHLLDELTLSWGADADGHGKVVWFEFDVGEGR